ncbi:hypothetical protein BJY52DRAFT_1227291 [Lactarius psammicola]|nr:hypothetical protein BJY52DRAFT_1227291 [Lactarius psammicola]
MLCMNPLDLLKVKFQLSMRGPEGGIGHSAPCATYTQARDDAGYITGWARISQVTRAARGSTFICAVTVVFTNPIWVVKSPDIHRAAQLARGAPWARMGWLRRGMGPTRGFRAIIRDEGGLYSGTSLVLVGVSNGALKFMAYEETKS